MKIKLLFLVMMICTLCISTEIYGDEIIPRNWYISYPNATCINEYRFTEDGKVINTVIDGYGNDVSSTEVFTYELGENKIVFNSIEMDGSADHYYIIDAGEYAYEIVDNVMHLVYSDISTDTIEWYLYPGINEAIEYSDTYKYTDAYISSKADEYGFVIEDGVLKGYFGDEMQVTIPDNVHTIDTYAFMSSDLRAVNIKEVIVPGTVTKLEASAFAYSNVKTVYLEDGVEEIGNSCFANSHLSDLYIPASVTVIGENIIETISDGNEIIIHSVKNSVAWNYFKEYTSDDTITYVGDYESYKQKDNSGLRQSSIVLLIASAVCVIGLIAYVVINYMSAKRRKRVS